MYPFHGFFFFFFLFVVGLIQFDYGGVVGCGLRFFVDCGHGGVGF